MNRRGFLSAVAIILCALAVQAQSGRRHTTPPPAAPVPTPSPEATPTPKKPDKEPEIFFHLGANRNFSFNNMPDSYYDAALYGCAERLRNLSSAGVSVTDKDFSRGDAIKRAKVDDKTYVVYMELTLDSSARSYDDLVVDYVVFAPGTAKVVTSGHSFLKGQRAGPVVVNPPGSSTNGMYREELLKRAGEDAAERILKALHLSGGGIHN